MTTPITSKCVLLGVIVGVVSLCGAAFGATTWYVSPNGADTNDGTTPETAFLTSKTATDKAKSGDTIILGKGTYTLECPSIYTAAIAVASGVTVCGETDNPRDTVIDVQGTGTAISFPGTGGTVSSLTVTNGYSTVQYRGSGISMGANAEPSADGAVNLVTNCVITCCRHENKSDGASLQIDARGRAVDCVISFCTNSAASVSCGAVALYNGGELVGSTVERCTGRFGAGIVGIVKSANAAAMLVKDCTVRGNAATSAGAGIRNVTTVRDCVVENNEAPIGGGVYYQGGFNSAFSARAFVVFSNTVVRANRATGSDGYGGGLAWGQYATITNFIVDSCVFSNNTSQSSANSTGGGAVYMRPNRVGGLVVLRNSLFTANEQLDAGTTREGAAVWLDGGVAAETVGGVIRVENCTFAANRNRSASPCSVYVGGQKIVFVTNTVVTANLDADGAVVQSIAGGGGNWRSNWAYSYISPGLSVPCPDETVINGTPPPKFQEGTWIPSARSPLRDAGLTLEWMADAHDLLRDGEGRAFRKRVLGKAVDIGCFEYAPPGLVFLIR